MFSYIISTLRYHNEAKQLDEVIHKLNLDDNKKLNLNNQKIKFSNNNIINNNKLLIFDLEKYILICPQF
jgi:hypothetical protein